MDDNNKKKVVKKENLLDVFGKFIEMLSVLGRFLTVFKTVKFYFYWENWRIEKENP